MQTFNIRWPALALIGATLAGCGSSGGGGGDTRTPSAPLTIGGTASGVAGSGLVLQNNAGDDLPVGGDGSFTFATAINSGSSYSVTVRTAPSNPAQECLVANGSGTATANVTNVTVTCTTIVSNVDTDGDGLTDSQELAIGSSPQLADTDGDGFSDGREVNNGGFNPLIADLPTVRIDVIGAPSIDINVIDTTDASYSQTYSTTYERGQQSSFSRSDTAATTATVSASTRVYSEAEASASPTSIGGSAKSGTESSVSASVTQEVSTSISSSSASSSRQEFGQLSNDTSGATRQTNGGALTALISVENTSDLSFVLSSVEIIASRRSGRSGTIQPIGTLVYDIDGGPQLISTGQSIQKTVSQDFSNANTLEALMADPSGLQFTIGSFDMTDIGDEDGRDWGRIAQDVNAQTAQIVIDYGDNIRTGGDTVERYQVATNVARDPVTNEVLGISMREVMTNAIEIPYSIVSADVNDENGQPTGARREIINSIRGLETTGIETGFWYVFTSSESADDSATNFDDLIMMPGDRISMVYMRDQDRDRIFDREEFLLGTSPTNPDTDGDGLDDFQEAREGWAISVEGEIRQVFSDPLNVDSDGDTLSDLQERDLGTDPDRADTDDDGIADADDENPTGPDRVSFAAEFGGPESTFEASFTVAASGGSDRAITRLNVDWGDGTPNFTLGCSGSCTSSITASPLHTYAQDGLYTVTVTADVQDAPSESRQYTVGVRPRFGQDIGLSWNSGWNENDDTRLIADIDGDGRDDIVGFGPDGTYTALSNGTGFDVATRQFADFATGSSFNKSTQRRLLANVVGNEEPDIVVFGADGVYIAANDGSGRFTVLCNGDPCTEGYSPAHGYDDFDTHPRYLSDMNADGLDDVVAFSDRGVIVALATGSGFDNSTPGGYAVRRFGPDSGGWDARFPRILADINGDGFDDIVGFGNTETGVAVFRPDLQTPTFQSTPNYFNLMVYARDWRIWKNPRLSADINNDGQDDVIGISNSNVNVSFATDNGGLTQDANTRTISTQFAYNDGWRIPNDQRYFTDINGDGFLDIVGFGPLRTNGIGGTYYALNRQNEGAFEGVREWLPEFSVNRGYTFDQNPRVMGDIDGDGRSDIIVFEDDSVTVVFALTAE